MIGAKVESQLFTDGQLAINLKFPYPTGGHCDDACNWDQNEKHNTKIISTEDGKALIKRVIDDTEYYVSLTWSGSADISNQDNNIIKLTPLGEKVEFTCEFLQDTILNPVKYTNVKDGAERYWNRFWDEGGMVDFSNCKDSRAQELERRVVLSEELMGVK